MKKVILILFVLTVLTLAACSTKSAETGSPTELAPVPAEYAGKTNPMGPEAAVAGQMCSIQTAPSVMVRKDTEMVLLGLRLTLLLKIYQS